MGDGEGRPSQEESNAEAPRTTAAHRESAAWEKAPAAPGPTSSSVCSFLQRLPAGLSKAGGVSSRQPTREPIPSPVSCHLPSCS